MYAYIPYLLHYIISNKFYHILILRSFECIAAILDDGHLGGSMLQRN